MYFLATRQKERPSTVEKLKSGAENGTRIGKRLDEKCDISLDRRHSAKKAELFQE